MDIPDLIYNWIIKFFNKDIIFNHISKNKESVNKESKNIK